MFSITEVREGLARGGFDTAATGAPYSGRWATVAPQQGETVLEGHQGEVLVVCEIPGEETSLLASLDESNVRVWDPGSGDLLNSFSVQGARLVTACAVPTSGGPLLATALADGRILLWDPSTGRRLRELNGHTGEVRYLCVVRSDGRDLLVSSAEDRTVRLWDPFSGRELRVLPEHTGPLTALVGPEHEGEAVVVSGRDRTALRWLADPAQDQPARRYEKVRTPTGTLCAFLDHGRGRIANGRGGWLEIWNSASGEIERSMAAKTGQIVALCALPAGDRGHFIAAADQLGNVLLWNLYSADPITVLRGHLSRVRSLCGVRVNHRTMLVSGGTDRTVRIWNLADLPRTEQHKASAAVKALCTVEVAGMTTLAHTSADAAVSRHSSPFDGSPVRVGYGGPPGVLLLCRTELDGRPALAGYSRLSNGVWLWHPESTKPARLLLGPLEPVTGLCALRLGDRELIAVGHADGAVRVWHPQRTRTLQVLRQSPAGVTALGAVAGPDPLLAAGTADGTVRLWRAADGAPLPPLSGHQGAVTALCTVEGEHGPLLASGSADHDIRLWDPFAGVEAHRLHGHGAPVAALHPVRLGRRSLLASASGDRTVAVWDPAAGRCLAEIPVYSPVHALTVTEGNLVVGLTDGLLAIRLNPALLGAN
jgi:WD40 repeat protein